MAIANPTGMAAAAFFGGLPSTVHAVATGRDPRQALRAAGTLVPGRRNRPALVAGIVVHACVSAGWATVLTSIDRRRHLGLLGGAAAGAAIAIVDLELVGRAYPAIRGLPRTAQWLDHLAFGAIVGASVRQPAPAQRGITTHSRMP